MISKGNPVNNPYIYLVKVMLALFVSMVFFTTILIPIMLLFFVFISMVASISVLYVLLNNVLIPKLDSDGKSQEESRLRQEYRNEVSRRHNGRLEHLKRLYRNGDISREKFEQLISEEIKVTESNTRKERDKI